MASGSPPEFDPGTPQKVVEYFNEVVKDNEERLIDEAQLKKAIDRLFYVGFNIRVVRLLMYNATSDYKLIIGPQDYVKVYRELKLCHGPFESLKERNGSFNGLIKPSKAIEGLASIGTKVSKEVFYLLFHNFTKQGSFKALTFGNFVECRLTIEGLKKKFNNETKETSGVGTSSPNENDFNKFMLAILPFAIS